MNRDIYFCATFTVILLADTKEDRNIHDVGLQGGPKNEATLHFAEYLENY